MFFHSLKYTYLNLIRTKSQVFWCFAFPLLLGTMFYFAFGGLGESEQFSPIPIAIVLEDTSDTKNTSPVSDIVRDTFDELGKPGDDQFFAITYTEKVQALELLKKKEVDGILYTGDSNKLLLSISSDMPGSSLNQSILSSFVEQFNMNFTAIAKTAKDHPENIPHLLTAMAEDTNYITDRSLTNGNQDESLSYFFNLLAMACLFAAMVGNDIAINSQANLSHLGARRNVSPVHRLVSILGDLTAALIYEFIAIAFSLIYFYLILKIDFGNQFGYIALASLTGCLTGISLGFFVGSIGRFNKNMKFGILMSVIMTGCMLSGLMIGSMRMLVEANCPILNRVNPAALISDSFYALTVYPSYERFWENITGLLILSALLCLGGFVMVRRKKYASL